MTQLKKMWGNYPFFASLIVFISAFLIFNSLYIDNHGINSLEDHFFNFKYSYLIRTEGLDVVKNFDWIYLSKSVQEHEGAVAPLYLFQIALIPFTYIKDMVLGLRLSDVFWGSFSISLIYYAFRKMRIKFPLFFTLILITSNFFLFRLLMGRSFVLTMGLVLLEIYLASEKKYKKLFLISFFHVLWHPTTFFMPFVMTGIVEAARYLDSHRIYFRNFFSSGLAILAGMAFFPGFISSFGKYFHTLISMFVTNASLGYGVEGEELNAKNSLDKFWGSQDIFFLLTVLGIGIVIYYYVSSKRKKNVEETGQNDNPDILMYASFLFLLMSVFGSITISGRFYDFYFIAAIMLGAVVLTKLCYDKKINVSPSAFRYIAASAFIFFIFAAGVNLLNRRTAISQNNYETAGEIARWIEGKSEEKDPVFLNNWSWFPIAFFYDHKNIYTMGMEPRTIYDYSPKLYWKWYNIFRYNYYCEKDRDCAEEANNLNKALQKLSGQEKDEAIKENGRKIIESVRNDFKAKFIMSDSELLNSTIEPNNDLIKDSFETSAGIRKFKAFELK